MKKQFLFILGACLAFTNLSCTDKCETTRTYRTTVPVTLSLEQIRSGITTEAPKDLVNPGKIYVKDNYLFINEVKKGIHVFDNSNPEKPQSIVFLKIPGVIDMAVKENTLYADNYIDIVAFDISNPKAIKETGRVKNVFMNGLTDGISWYYNAQNQTVTDYEIKTVTETIRTNCGQNGINPIYYAEDVAFKSGTSPSASSGSNSGATATGAGGSMARFTIYEDYLYTVSQSDLLLFNIKILNKPTQQLKINLGWGIETIFPYKDKLFIGSNTGMYIYDNKNPEKPERLSIFQHARACDPVIVHNDIAYVTLRSGWCGTAPNRLDVVNVANLSSPRLIKSYDMKNPAGLGIDFPNLFICEGKYGLKSFDATSATNIMLQQHIEKIDAYDIITLEGKHLLMVGKDGLYQYDASNPKNLKLLSVIPVKKEI
ncbi:LVIVD repeat-containing protein [Emticicia sp.]|uniref:LVIVD repeat-containing protein n=1 Tax=Emticicia sp. TaxID=1930953 RepID=UPI00375246EE